MDAESEPIAVANQNQVEKQNKGAAIMPNSSENVVKIKSVCFSGRKFRWLWVPERKPLPQTLPEPRAILPE